MAIFNPFNITPYSLYKELQRHHDYYDKGDMELEEAIKEFYKITTEDNWSITPSGNLIGTSKLLDSISCVFTNFFGSNYEWEAHLSEEDLHSTQHRFITTLLRLHPNKEVVKKFYQMTTQDFIEERNSIILDWLKEYYDDFFEATDYKFSQEDSNLLSKTKINDEIIINIYEDRIGILTEAKDKDIAKTRKDIIDHMEYTILSRYGYPQVLLHYMAEDL